MFTDAAEAPSQIAENGRNLYDLQAELQKAAEHAQTTAKEIAEILTGPTLEKSADRVQPAGLPSDVLSRTWKTLNTVSEINSHLHRIRRALGAGTPPSGIGIAGAGKAAY